MRQLAVGDRVIEFPIASAELDDGRRGDDRHNDCSRRAAVCVDVRATVIGAWLAVAVAMIVGSADVHQCSRVGMLMAATIEVLVDERVRFRELRRMKNRQLAAAQHGDSEQYDNQQLSHNSVHVLSRPASAPFVKSRPRATMLRPVI